MKRVRLKVERVRLAPKALQRDEPEPVRINPKLLRERPIIGSKAKECEFCGHRYLSPCDAKRQKRCPNIKLDDRAKQKSAAKRASK